MRTRLRLSVVLLLTICLLVLAGCGDSNSPAPTPTPRPSPTPVPVSVSIDPATPTISVTETVTFTATVSGATNTAVTWTASEGTVVDGLFTPPLMAGNYTVTATSQADTTKSATANVTVTAPAPVVTSTPPLIAVVDSEYTYAPTATSAPEGTTVAFALTNAPANATVEEGVIRWTPSEAQGRAMQSFTMTATSSAGGVSTVTWDVNTFGVVRGTYVDKYWHLAPEAIPTPSPEVATSAPVPPTETSLTSTDVPRDLSDESGWSVWAMFRFETPDGIQIGATPGTGFDDGTFEVVGVPAGDFWLGFRYEGEDFEWYRTDGATTFDYGSDYYGRPDNGDWMPTTFGFELFGVSTPWYCRPFRFEVVSPNAGADYETRYRPEEGCGATVASFDSYAYLRSIDSQQGDVTYVLQRDRVEEQSQMAADVKVDAVTTGMALDWLTTYPESTTYIDGTMSSTPANALNVNLKASEWSKILLTAAPGIYELRPWKASLSVLPFVTDIYAYPQADYDRRKDLADAYEVEDTDRGAPSSSLELATIVSKGNAVDQDLGTFRYVNPFPASWKVMFGAQQKAAVPVIVPGAEYPTDFRVNTAFLTDSIPDGPIEPMMSAVKNPKINGEDFFTLHELNLSDENPDVVISWEPPAGLAPFGYQVAVHVLRSDMMYADHERMWSFYTSDTSVTINGFLLGYFANEAGGNSVAFKIRAMSDARADVRTAPWRSKLPIADTSIVSGPVMMFVPYSEAAISQVKSLVKEATKTVDISADPKKAATAARLKARKARSFMQDDQPETQPTK